jgi:hypothetical protein
MLVAGAALVGAGLALSTGGRLFRRRGAIVASRSRRGRQLVILVAVAVAIGFPSAWVYWQRSSTINGVALNTGQLRLQVNDPDPFTAFTSLGFASMVPGGSTAGVLKVSNVGTVPLSYDVDASASNADGKGLQGLTVSATGPTDPGLSYVLQVIRLSDGSQVGPDHPLTRSGSTGTYVFTNNEFPGIPTDVHTDFYARIVVRLTNAPTWQARSQINFDEDDSSGLFGLAAGFYYGSPVGSTSPGGQPGACSTSCNAIQFRNRR